MTTENTAATALLRACCDLLAAQVHAQPDAFPAITEGVRAAAELRFEVTMMTGEPRSAAMRIVTLDGQGGEVMLVRALDLAPPQRAPLQ